MSLYVVRSYFVFIEQAPTEIYTYWHTLSLHDALPIFVCPCDHYGYVFAGRIRARYADGSEEVIGPGEVYWIPKGHVLIYEEATHHLEINSHRELRELMEVILRKDRKSTRLNSSH